MLIDSSYHSTILPNYLRGFEKQEHVLKNKFYYHFKAVILVNILFIHWNPYESFTARSKCIY